ncbi:hypothetical protein G5714_018000 [Onychostoma macrolepis]|uniref:Uncharacterized protein n=1 Tax=Onychostoma macrolepis TaxID=369639 RepID=A0A7J6C2Q4_9TELE|nr:hypothetical protein G5714_018000 [Onychostoma macrolepis]
MVYIEDSLSSSSLGDTEGTSESDDTALLIRSPPERNKAKECRLAQMIENILKSSPGGEKVINEYARTKGLSDARRCDMVKILVANLTNEHGTSPSRHLKEEYAKGIISLFPCLADPRSKLGYHSGSILEPESLTEDLPESLTVEQPESLTEDLPESLTVEQPENLTKESEAVFILNLVSLSSPHSPTSLSPPSSTTFTAVLPPQSSPPPPPLPCSKSLQQRKERTKTSICSPAPSATSVSPPSLIPTDLSLPQSCPPPAASSISQSLSQEGPSVKKKRKGCRKCSRQKIFLFDQITGDFLD